MLDFVDGITDFDTVFELDSKIDLYLEGCALTLSVDSCKDFPLQTSSEDTTEGSESFDSK